MTLPGIILFVVWSANCGFLLGALIYLSSFDQLYCLFVLICLIRLERRLKCAVLPIAMICERAFEDGGIRMATRNFITKSNSPLFQRNVPTLLSITYIPAVIIHGDCCVGFTWASFSKMCRTVKSWYNI